MTAFNWRIGQARGPNLVAANPQRLESADGQRWATGRNVKRHLADRRFDAVEVWTLKQRVDGKAATIERNADRKRAEEWVK